TSCSWARMAGRADHLWRERGKRPIRPSRPATRPAADVMEERTGKSKVVELHEAASLLHLSADAVRSLTAAGYLAPADHNGEPRYALGDLKAFVARNADDGSGIAWDDEGDALDPLA